MPEDVQVDIGSRDFWFKVVEMLQQNWALIEPNSSGEGVVIYFIGDTSGVFDLMTFPSLTEAEIGLRRNGFSRFSEDKEAQKFIALPKPPFWQSQHPNGPIYSSGRYWH